MLQYYLKDMKKRGGSFELLKQEIIDKDKLWGDILFGVLSGVTSVIIWLVIVKIEMSYLPNKGNTNVSDHTPIIIKLLVLCIIFAVFDWTNGGLSFFAGLIWYLFYIKRRRLIVPMVGHCMINLIPIILSLFIAS